MARGRTRGEEVGMRQQRAARGLAGVVAVGAVACALVGCSTVRQVPLESIAAEGIGKATVVSKDNYTYNFEQVHVQGDSLVGTYYVVEERVSANGNVAFVDVPRYTALPTHRVERVEIKRLDYGSTALLGAGATLFTIWATSLDDEPDTQQNNGNTKRIPTP
jgi:hypothetical protein